MAIERDATIRVKVQGAKQAEAQLDDVSDGLGGVDKSAKRASKSVQTTGASLAQAGEKMEQSLKPIDSTFKGFDRVNGILGQVTNAARLLSGAALVELGGAFIQIGRRVADFVTGAESARKALAAQKRAAEQAAKAYRDLKSALPGGLFTGDPVEVAKFASERALLARYEDQYADALNRSKDAIAGIASLRGQAEDARAALRAAEDAEAAANLGPVGETRRDSPVVARLRARATALGNELADREAAADNLRELGAVVDAQRQQVDDLQRIITGAIDGEEAAVKAAARGRGGRGGGAAGASRVSEVDQILALVRPGLADSLGLGPAGDVNALLGPVQAGGGGTTGSVFAALASDMATATVEAELFSAQMDHMKGRAVAVASAFGTVDSALGAMQGGLAAVGIESEALARVQAGVQAALMGANAAMAFADGLKAAAGGILTPPNPLQATANFIAAAAYTSAAVAYGAVAAGAGGAGSVGAGGSGGVGAAPSPGAFGSAAAQANGAGNVTINVNSPGAAFLSRSERQRMGTELGGMVVTAMGARGSGLRTDFRRELGRS